jgi:4-diphosphocytidyl-2C-methyl-D-erythritol kinase
LLNDLQESAERNLADLQGLRLAFDRLGLVSHQLTGSGSAYFGIARQSRSASTASERLRGQGWPWTAVAIAGA